MSSQLSLGISIDTPLTIDYIRSKVSDYEIYSFYLGVIVTGPCYLNSPFHTDVHPSFSLYRRKNSPSVRWKDHATGSGGDVLDFVSKLHYNISISETLAQINQDLKLGHLSKPTRLTEKRQFKVTELKAANETSELSIQSKPYDKEELDYWGKYGITEKLLLQFKVFAVLNVFINNTVVWSKRKGQPIFVYVFQKDAHTTFKVYRPLSPKKEKWLSNTDHSVIQGWDQLDPTGDILILTKSLKDVMVLRTLGYNAISLQQEVGSIKPNVLDQLKDRFKEIFILYDFDRAGVIGTNKLRKRFPFLQPRFLLWTRNKPFKDISDYRSLHTLEETKSFLKTQLWPK
jgi:hypothetical protein